MTIDIDRVSKRIFENELAVFPLKSNSKAPATVNGVKNATSDPDLIDTIIKGNYGVAAGASGIQMIDIDCKGDRNALSQWNTWYYEFELPDTYTVKTPSGGLHIYINNPEILEMFTRPDGTPYDHVMDIIPGLEIKIRNSYVVGAGSSIDGKEYTVLEDQPITKYPVKFLQHLQTLWLEKQQPKKLKTAIEQAEQVAANPHIKETICFHLESAVKSIIETWPEVDFPLADLVEWRDNHTFNLSGKIARTQCDCQRLTEQQVIYLMDKYWTPRFTTFEAEWADGSKLRQKVRSSMKNGTIPDINPVSCNGKAFLDTESITEVVVESETPKPVFKIAFDVNKLPPEIVQAAAGLTAINEYVPFHYHLLCAFGIAGQIIGKRIMYTNGGTKYYPNLWIALLGSSGMGKTGTYSVLRETLPASAFAPASPTYSAFIDVLGTVVNWKHKDGTRKLRSTIQIEKDVIEAEAKKDKRGLLLLVDEMTDSIKKIIGEKHQELAGFLRLSNSGMPEEHPRSTANFERVAYDICVSFLGFTQPEVWDTEYSDPKFKHCGFISRFIIANELNPLTNIPIGHESKWNSFTNVTQVLLKEYGKHTAKDSEDSFDFKMIRDMKKLCKYEFDRMNTVPGYCELQEILGDLAEVPKKIMGLSLKLCIILDLFAPHKTDNLRTAIELVYAYLYCYYFEQIAEATLDSTDYKWLAYIKKQNNAGKQVTAFMIAHKYHINIHIVNAKLSALRDMGYIKIAPHPKNPRSQVITVIKLLKTIKNERSINNA